MNITRAARTPLPAVAPEVIAYLTTNILPKSPSFLVFWLSKPGQAGEARRAELRAVLGLPASRRSRSRSRVAARRNDHD